MYSIESFTKVSIKHKRWKTKIMSYKNLINEYQQLKYLWLPEHQIKL